MLFINLILSILIPLILTILIELIIWFFIIKRFDNLKLFWLLIIAVNLATNPVLNLLHSFFDPLRSLWLLEIFLEFGVIFIEALIFYLVYKKEFWKLILISLILNFCSYFLGLIIFTPNWL